MKDTSLHSEKQIPGQQTIADYPGVLPGEDNLKKKPKKSKKSAFNNFEQNQYDFEELEKQILDN